VKICSGRLKKLGEILGHCRIFHMIQPDCMCETSMARSLCHTELKLEVCCILNWLKTNYLALHIIIVGSGLV